MSAGDLVLTKTCSLPIRTSCENVGTVVPLFHSAADSAAKFRAKFPTALAKRITKNARAHSNAERSTANPEKQARNSADTPRRKNCTSEFPLGEAYSAFRGWRPIPAALLSHSIVHCSGTEDIPFQLHWDRTTPNKQQSISRKVQTVKSFDTCQWKTYCSSPRLAQVLPKPIGERYSLHRTQPLYHSRSIRTSPSRPSLTH